MLPTCRRLLLLSLLLSAFGGLSLAQSAFPTNEDLRHIRALTDPRLSPDGQRVLYRVIDATADGGRAHLWITDLATNSARQLTFSPAADKRGEHNGEWMPDGSAILFIAKRGEHSQLYRLPMTGGDSQPYDLKTIPIVDVTKLPDYFATSPAAKPEDPKPVPIDVSNFSISPDGKLIAIIARDPESPAEKKLHDDKADAAWVDHEVHGSRLYIYGVRSEKLSTTAIPPDVEDVAWAPDSIKLLAFTEGPNSQGDLGPARKAFVLNFPNLDTATAIDKLPPTIRNGSWSLDGTLLYFLAQAEQDTPPGTLDLYEFTFATNAIRNLTNGFQGSIEYERPIPRLQGGVFKSVATGVNTTAIRIQSGTTEILKYPTPLAGSFHTNAKQTGLVFLGSSSTEPVSLYYQANADLSLPAHRIASPRLTPENVRTVESKLVRYQSEKFTIEGLLYLPPEAATKKVPLVMDIHGGPSGAFQDGYDPFVAHLNGQGWAVFRPNIRGSSNYGAPFLASNKNDLGGGDYRDVMNGVDYLLKNFPFDPDRMALMGYSYGGEMAGFVVGKTNRFKAIVCGAPVIDQFSEYGTENDSWYDRWYFGKPWEHVEDAWRQSPLAGAPRATTPFLLLQGESDKTDPLGESQQMYRALRQAGVQVELVTYPREDHGPLARGLFGTPTVEPWHGFDARRRTVEFIKNAFDKVGAGAK